MPAPDLDFFRLRAGERGGGDRGLGKQQRQLRDAHGDWAGRHQEAGGDLLADPERDRAGAEAERGRLLRACPEMILCCQESRDAGSLSFCRFSERLRRRRRSGDRFGSERRSGPERDKAGRKGPTLAHRKFSWQKVDITPTQTRAKMSTAFSSPKNILLIEAQQVAQVLTCPALAAAPGVAPDKASYLKQHKMLIE